jgi:hypothetical protein
VVFLRHKFANSLICSGDIIAFDQKLEHIKVKKYVNNKEFVKELERRTHKFAVSIIHLSRTLPNTSEAKE